MYLNVCVYREIGTRAPRGMEREQALNVFEFSYVVFVELGG